MKDFAQRVKNIEVSTIRAMMTQASKLADVVSLGQGIPSFDLPEELREKLIEALRNQKDINKYTLGPGLLLLREKVARYLEEAKGIRVNPEKELCITKGAIGGLFSAISALVERGEEVILLSPTYEPYIKQIMLAEGKPIFVPLIEEKGWRPDIEAIKSAVSQKTKAIIICDPSNPTGGLFEKEDVEKIARLAQEKDLFIITDETYDFLTYEGREHFSFLSRPEIQERLIACFSFSKKYAMTGFRVGFVYARDYLMKEIWKVHDESTICTPTLSQYAALFCLNNLHHFVASIREEFSKRRELICQRLERLPELFEYQKPMGAYYVFPRVKLKMKSLELSQKLLYEAKVVTIPGIAFGPSGEGHLRLSFAAEEKEINQAFDRIEKYWQKLLK